MKKMNLLEPSYLEVERLFFEKKKNKKTSNLIDFLFLLSKTKNDKDKLGFLWNKNISSLISKKIKK